MEKHPSEWHTLEPFFVCKLLELTCGPAYMEERNKLNESGLRWQKIFVDSLQGQSADAWPVGLWLFTMQEHAHTMMRPLLRTSIDSLPIDAQQGRNSLYRLRSSLLSSNAQFSMEFHLKLKGSRAHSWHSHFSSFFWHVRLMVEAPRVYFFMRENRYSCPGAPQMER